jgi:hypothetical protein
MSETSSFDQEAYRIAVASIRRHSMNAEDWDNTLIGELHPGIVGSISLNPGEIAIASSFYSAESWWVITTRRISSCYQGSTSSLDPRFGVEATFGNFKGIKRSQAPEATATEVATIIASRSQECLRFEFETGKASMAPIYGCMFWSRVTRFHYGVDVEE